MMNDDYEDHRRRQMAEARDSFAAWERRLSPKQRAIAAGIGVAEDDNEMANGRSADLAEAPLASYQIDMADAVDRFSDALAETFDLPNSKAVLMADWMEKEIQRRAMTYRATDINNIAGVFIDTKNPKLFSAGLAFAGDLASLNGLGTQAEYARQIGLTRSAVSKVTKFWQKLLNLPPSAHMKSEAACKAYSAVGKDDHWRNRKVDGSEKAARALKRLNVKFKQNKGLPKAA